MAFVINAILTIYSSVISCRYILVCGLILKIVLEWINTTNDVIEDSYLNHSVLDITLVNVSRGIGLSNSSISDSLISKCVSTTQKKIKINNCYEY